jgi:hypothetical protein
MLLTHFFVSISRADHTENMSGFEYFTYILFQFQSGFRIEVKSVASVARDWLNCLHTRLPVRLSGSLNAKHGLPFVFRLFLCLAPTNIHYQTLSYTYRIVYAPYRYTSALAIHLSITISTLGSVDHIP